MKLIENQEDYELQGKINFHGVIIDVENKKGTYRTGKDPDGKSWKTHMKNHYGRIRGTKSNSDDEELDVYVGDDKNADNVYQIYQLEKQKDGSFSGFDEFKYMIGFSNAGEAVESYLSHYDDPGFFGGLKEIPFGEFKEKIDDYISNNEQIKEVLKLWGKLI